MGEPLLISDVPLQPVPNCNDCGAKRVFEFQVGVCVASHLESVNVCVSFSL